MWDAQRGILDLAGLFTKDGTQEFLFRRQFGFALRRDLANENVLRADLGSNVDDAALVQSFDHLLAHVGDIPRGLLRAEFGSTGIDFKLLYINRCEEVVTDNALADENCVREVATLPAHKGDQNVLTKS